MGKEEAGSRLVTLGRSLHLHLSQFVGQEAPLEASRRVGLLRLRALGGFLCGLVPGFRVPLRGGFCAAQHGGRRSLLLLPPAGERFPEPGPTLLRLRRQRPLRGGPRRQRAEGKQAGSGAGREGRGQIREA